MSDLPAGDDASWLVIADRLTEEGNPLGEYIVLTLKYEDRSMPELTVCTRSKASAPSGSVRGRRLRPGDDRDRTGVLHLSFNAQNAPFLRG